MENALSLHADEVHDELPDANSHQLAMRVFQAITERSDDERGTRRPTRLGQLCDIVNGSQDEVAVVLDAYRRAGRTFVMPGQDVELQPETVIDISHESLMRVWQRLRGWVDEESQALRIYRRLAETAALHAEGEAGVYRDPDLQIATSWRDSSEPTEAWAHRYHAGFETAMEFLDKSWAAAHAEEEAREAARKRELEQARKLADSERKRAEVQARAKKRLYVLLAGISAALMVAVGMYIYAEGQRELAEANRKQAVANAETATENEKLAMKNASEAQQNAAEAKRQETIALKNADEATKQADLAEAAREDTRRGLYRSEMLIAHRGLLNQEGLEQVAQTLDNWRPKPGDEDFRGWEWYYLDSLQSPDQQFISTGSVFQGAADWSPTGKLVAYGASDFSIVLYDLEGQREVRRLTGHTHRLTSLQFSRDGKLLASGSRDNTARIWDVELGLEKQLFTGHRGWIHKTSVSPDGSRLLTSSFDNSARVWNIKTGRQLEVFQGAFGSFATSEWSPSGDLIATAGADHDIVIRSGSDYSVAKTLKTQSVRIFSLNWSNDSGRLAIGADDGDVEILDVATGKPIALLTGHNGFVNSIRWSPDDQKLISGGNDGIGRIWDAAKLSLDTSLAFQVFQVINVAWSPDGKEALVNGRNGRLWINQPERITKTESASPHDGLATSVAWHPSRRVIAYGGDDRKLHIVSLERSQDSRSVEGHSGKINAVCWSPNGNWIATGGSDASLRIWDAKSYEVIAVLDDLQADVQSLAWSPDGRHLAMGLGKPNSSPFGNGPVTLDRGIQILDLTEPSMPKVSRALTGHRSVLAVAWNATSDQLATAGINAQSDNGRIRIWDVTNGTEVNAMTMPTEIVFALQWTPDGTTIISGSSGPQFRGQIAFRSVEDGTIRKTFEGQQQVLSIALNRDATRVLSTGSDRTVKLWDTNSGAEVLTLSSSSTAVHSAAWSSDETQIAAVGAELSIYDAYGSYLADHSPAILETLAERESTTGLTAVELLARAELYSLQNNWDAAATDLEKLNQTTGRSAKWFLMPWRIQGPFSGGMNRRTPLEQATDPFVAAAEELPGPLSDWLPIRLTADAMLDMAAFTGGANNCSCYAISRIYSVSGQRAAFLMGTDDSHRIWFNGQLIDEFFGNRPAQPDQDVVTVSLKKGWNTLLFKVHSGFGGHGFYCRLSDQPLQIARALNRKKQFADAVVAWDKLIADNPREKSLLAARLQASLGAGLHERAAEDLAALGKLVPENISLQVNLADIATARGQYAEAIDALTKAIEVTGGSPEHLIRRGELNQLVGNKEQATKDLARSIATKRTASGGFTRTSGTRMIGRVVNAVERLDLVKSGRNATVPWRYSYEAPSGSWNEINFDDSGWQTGNSPFASGNIRKTTWPQEKEKIWLRHEFVVDKIPRGELLVKAFIDDDAVIFLNGVRIAAGRWVGGRWQNLRPAVHGAAILRPGKNVLAVMCQNTLFHNGIDVGLSVMNPNSQAVVDILEKAQAAAPDDTAISILRGKQLLRNQRWAEASKAYRQGILGVADDHWSWYEIIGIEWLLGNNEAMQAHVDKMIELFRVDPSAMVLRRAVNRAVYSDHIKYDPKVIDDMVRRFVDGQPGHGFTPLIHGVVLFRKGDYSAAEEQFAKAEEIGRNSNWVFHGVRQTFQARIAFRQGNLDKAYQHLWFISRMFEIHGPSSHDTRLSDFWIDQMPLMLQMAEAGEEMKQVLDGKDLTPQQRRLGILSWLAIARRHRFARQHDKFIKATQQALTQMVALVRDHNDVADRQRAMFLLWQQLNLEPEFQLPRKQLNAALESLFPASSISQPAAEWIRLKPVSFESQNKVESTVEPDDSIYVGGNNPRRNVYTVRYGLPEETITGVRLGLVCDRRLPGKGPGRHAGIGNVHIHDLAFRLHSDDDSGNTPLKVASATSAFFSFNRKTGENYASGLFDDDSVTYWDLWPMVGRDHAVVAKLADPVIAGPGSEFGVTIACTSRRFGFHTLGRFNLSVTTSPSGMAVKRCWGDPSPQSVSYWSIVATGLMNENRFDEAKPWVERAINDSEPSTVFDWLVAARYYRRVGNQKQAEQLYRNAVDWASGYPPWLPILNHQLKLGAPAVAKAATDAPTK
ncbi:MAG: hypothetical protein QF363_02760 [Planctomycetaceae bacterium]|nr:hypothetical protein [Planctomycetaceae bacterium]